MTDLPPEFEKLSKYQRYHLGMTSIGLIVAACAFLAVFFQVQNLTEQTRRQTEAINLQRQTLEAQIRSLAAQKIAIEAQVWQMIITQQLDISKTIVANAELLPYFSEGRPLTRADKNFNRLMAIADMYLDFFDGFDDKHIRSLEGMEDKGKYWVLWERYFQDSFASSPALCLRFSKVEDWYTKGMGKYAEAGCKKHREAASNPAVNTDAAR